MKYSSLPLLALFSLSLFSLSLAACSPDGVGDLAAGTNDSSGGLAADFEADLVQVIEGLEVRFADHSTGTVFSWSWDLDGDSIEDSTQQNPSFIYRDGGLYTVSLAVNGGASSETKAGYIQVEFLPEAGFESQDLAGPLDHEVDFSNLSNHADAFAWEFQGGNPSASTEEDPPTVTYDKIGFKTVRITVTGVGGFDDTSEKIGYIAVSPRASFTVEDSFAGDGAGEGAVKGAAGPEKPLVVQFQNISNQNGENDDVDYFWDFGEGDPEVFTDNLLDLVNEYENPGKYTVLLRAESEYGDNTLMINQYVDVVPTVLDPSFELQTAAVAPQTPWTTFFGLQGEIGHLIRSTDEGDTEDLMPFPPDPGDGSSVQWVEVDTTSTDSAQPPLNAGQDPPVETDDPGGRGGAGVRQQIAFALDAEGIPCSILQFEAAFITSETLEELTFNDYMSVDLSFKGAHYNLYYRDTFSDFTEELSVVHGEPITPVETVSVDLLNLFDFPPRLSGEQFTLWVSVGNVGDDGVPSWGYVDNVRLLAIGGDVVVEFDSNGDANDESGDCPVEVTFLDTTQGVTTIQRKWQFGDGAVDLGNDPNPTHIYESPDTYDVRLTIVAQEGTGSLMKPDHVDVQQTVAFHADSVVTPFILDGTPVTFINDSSGARSYRWTITEPGGQTEIVKSNEDSVPYTFHFPSFLPGDPDGNPDTWEVLLEAYCGNDTASGTPDGSSSMFIQVRQGFGDLYPIMQASCAVTFCHDNAHPCIVMATSEATLYDRLIDAVASDAPGCSCSGETHKQYVDESQEGDTALAQSLLWRKLRPPGSNDPEEGDQCGARMPAIGSLSGAQLELFEAWMRGGAKE